MTVEAVTLWNEPNNRAHWDFELDVGWKIYADMVKLAAREIRRERPELTQALGGMSPIDPDFALNMKEQGVLDVVDVVAVHGFPLDWNHWQLDEWPDKLDAVRAVTDKPIWVSAVGTSTFGAEEIQEFGLRRSAELLLHRSPRVHWYSLYDLPRPWPTTTRARETECSAYYRQFYMGLLKENGKPKRALRHFATYTPAIGLCQWFQHQDPRLEDAVAWMRRLGVKKLRTGLSWADSHRPNADAWFDRQMKALEPFDVTVTFCFTPGSLEHRTGYGPSIFDEFRAARGATTTDTGVSGGGATKRGDGNRRKDDGSNLFGVLGLRDDHASPPRSVDEFAEFCARMVRRYC